MSIKARYPVFAMFCGFCDKMGSQKHKIQNTTFLKYQSSKSLNSYYVFTTFDGINLPRFASICLFRYIFNNLHEKCKPRKSCQNTANQSISGGKINMIKILFVCHGNIRTWTWKFWFYKGNWAEKTIFTQSLHGLRKGFKLYDLGSSVGWLTQERIVGV